ncbi:MAG TPA: ROK family transcriptional regulator [Micromonosporaceae bacterium]|jgi:predicted NBD/HSP70 family sugar kinase
MPSSSLRPLHRRALAEIGCWDQISRTELADHLELPKATVTAIVRDLIEAGLVEPAPEHDAPGRPGRPAGQVTLSGPPPAIGVVSWSVGLLRTALATPSGRVLAQAAQPMDKQSVRVGVAADLLDATATEAGYATSDLACVVLSIPAPYQRGVGAPARRSEHGTAWASWPTTDPVGELAERTGTQVLAENDANLGALGEYVFGTGRGKHSLIYVKLGEFSVGAGLIVNGWLHRGVTGFAGELAHIQVADDGPLCACGGRGCLIHSIGPGLLATAQPAYEQPLTYPRMVAMAADGDPGMARLLRDLGRTVGRPLADACTLLNPEAIVVDGTAGESGGFIIDGITEAVERYAAPPAAAAVTVQAGMASGDAEVAGAVALARREVDLSVRA